MKAVTINENYYLPSPLWDARITITEAEMNPGVTVRVKKPYIRTIEQENDPSINEFAIVERHRLSRKNK